MQCDEQKCIIVIANTEHCVDKYSCSRNDTIFKFSSEANKEEYNQLKSCLAKTDHVYGPGFGRVGCFFGDKSYSLLR